jgi:hypothetical protein
LACQGKVKMESDPIIQIEEHKRRVAGEAATPIEAGTALEFLQAVYRDKTAPFATRMRAAMACLQFERPKMQAVLYKDANGEYDNGYDNGLAERLEKAMEAARQVDRERAERTAAMKTIEGQVAKPQGQTVSLLPPHKRRV